MVALSSMTGFARAEGGDDGATWAWELRCVNGRSLDVRCRLPAGHDRLDRIVRKAIAERFKRGNLSANLTISRGDGQRRYQINQALLAKIEELAVEMKADRPGLDALVTVRGLFEPLEEEAGDAPTRDGALLATLGEAVASLDEMRQEEGARLIAILEGQIDLMADLTAQAEACAATRPGAIRERLKRMVGELMAADAGLPEERLAHEVALLVGKADVREELDRLGAHIAAARDLLESDGPAGRKLEFLCQELNREVNTICSKSGDVALTRIGLDLKAVVDQMREQVQNIE